jgi:hypothetical protein
MLTKALRSPHPALNIYRRNEEVACFTLMIQPSLTVLPQPSYSLLLLPTDIHSIKRDKQFTNTLEDKIIQRGAHNRLLSDRGQAFITHKVEDILGTFCFDKWQSEPHQHHQNPAEPQHQTLKNATNRIIDCTGAPSHVWLLC